LIDAEEDGKPEGIQDQGKPIAESTARLECNIEYPDTRDRRSRDAPRGC
jgi:hypothetical protein